MKKRIDCETAKRLRHGFPAVEAHFHSTTNGDVVRLRGRPTWPNSTGVILSRTGRGAASRSRDDVRQAVHFVSICRTLTEYGANVWSKLVPRPSTFVATGTTLVGSAIVFVSRGSADVSTKD